MPTYHLPDTHRTNDVTRVTAPGPWDQNGDAVDSPDWTPAGIAADVAKQATFLAQEYATAVLQAAGQEALRQLALRPGQHVLEAGCGTGLFLDLLAAGVGPAEQVTGIDLSPDFVEIARQRATALGANVSVEQADIRHLPFPDATFDAAHCERVLMHLADPTSALAELRRVLKPGGLMVAAETDFGSIRIDHPDQELITLLMGHGPSGAAQPDMGLTLVRRFLDAGYEQITVQPVISGVRELATLVLLGIDLAKAADGLVNDGIVTRERADAGLAWLTETDRRGAWFSYGGLIVASGRA